MGGNNGPLPGPPLYGRECIVLGGEDENEDEDDKSSQTEKLSTPSPLWGTTPVSGIESVTIENTAPANCPPETGWTRSEATEGVDKTKI